MDDAAQWPEPCPFCGSSDVGGASGIVHCYGCSAQIEDPDGNTDKALARWNRRENQQSMSFQKRVEPWLLACFGHQIADDMKERCDRFIEEALELVQSVGYSQSEAHQLVDYVFNRPKGDPPQEVGGVMVTLAALCRAANLSMHDSGETELVRIWGKVEKIRDKQAAKPAHSPLPEYPPAEHDPEKTGVEDLVKFLADMWTRVDSFVYKTCPRQNMGDYPVVQGTSNQTRLRKLGRLPYRTEGLGELVDQLLRNHDALPDVVAQTLEYDDRPMEIGHRISKKPRFVSYRDSQPLHGQRVILVRNGVVQHCMPIYDNKDTGWDFSEFDADLLDADPDLDHWMPAPKFQE